MNHNPKMKWQTLWIIIISTTLIIVLSNDCIPDCKHTCCICKYDRDCDSGLQCRPLVKEEFDPYSSVYSMMHIAPRFCLDDTVLNCKKTALGYYTVLKHEDY